jgi:hypothetical protein
MARETEMPAGAVTCVACGWVSMATPRREAEAYIWRWNARREADSSRLADWPTPMTTDSYRCTGCGGTGPYRPAEPGDLPLGATVNCVVWDG